MFHLSSDQLKTLTGDKLLGIFYLLGGKKRRELGRDHQFLSRGGNHSCGYAGEPLFTTPETEKSSTEVPHVCLPHQHVVWQERNFIFSITNNFTDQFATLKEQKCDCCALPGWLDEHYEMRSAKR